MGLDFHRSQASFPQFRLNDLHGLGFHTLAIDRDPVKQVVGCGTPGIVADTVGVQGEHTSIVPDIRHFSPAGAELLSTFLRLKDGLSPTGRFGVPLAVSHFAKPQAAIIANCV